MNKIRLVAVVALISITMSFTIIKSVNWKVAQNYSVKFGKSAFTGLKATILFDEVSPEKSKIAATIDARTIKTGNILKDFHARDALATDKFPIIIFITTTIKRLDGTSRYEATGNLTLKGITKEIKFLFTFDSKNDVVDRFPIVSKKTFHGAFTIVPADYNVTRSGTPDEVTIELDIPVSE